MLHVALLFLPSPPPVESQREYYRAIIRSVYDGDTFRADIHVGLGIVLADHPCRLRRINAPELKGTTVEAGKAAKEHLVTLLKDGVTIEVQSKRQREKYGRLLVEAWTKANGQWLNVSDAMVAAKHAVPGFLDLSEASYGDVLQGVCNLCWYSRMVVQSPRGIHPSAIVQDAGQFACQTSTTKERRRLRMVSPCDGVRTGTRGVEQDQYSLGCSREASRRMAFSIPNAFAIGREQVALDGQLSRMGGHDGFAGVCDCVPPLGNAAGSGWRCLAD